MILIVKSRKFPEGTVRTWKNGKKVKKINGKWIEIHKPLTISKKTKDDFDKAKSIEDLYKTFFRKIKTRKYSYFTDYVETSSYDKSLNYAKSVIKIMAFSKENASIMADILGLDKNKIIDKLHGDPNASLDLNTAKTIIKAFYRESIKHPVLLHKLKDLLFYSGYSVENIDLEEIRDSINNVKKLSSLTKTPEYILSLWLVKRDNNSNFSDVSIDSRLIDRLKNKKIDFVGTTIDGIDLLYEIKNVWKEVNKMYLNSGDIRKKIYAFNLKSSVNSLVRRVAEHKYNYDPDGAYSIPKEKKMYEDLPVEVQEDILYNGSPIHIYNNDHTGVNSSYMVILKKDNMSIDAIFKPEKEERKYLRRSITEGSQAIREIASYMLNKELGFDLVPPTVLRENNVVAQAIVSGSKSFVDSDDKNINEVIDELPVENLYEMTIFDWLIYNTDRHYGNFLYRDDVGEGTRIFLIDNGLSFPDDASVWINNLYPKIVSKLPQKEGYIETIRIPSVIMKKLIDFKNKKLTTFLAQMEYLGFSANAIDFFRLRFNYLLENRTIPYSNSSHQIKLDELYFFDYLEE